MWPRREQVEPVVERIDVDALHAVLFDILRELRFISRLLEDDNGSEEEDRRDEP